MKNNKLIVSMNESGTMYWKLNDELHCEDGPAVVLANGTRYWWVNGKQHREDGPAIEYADGSRYWFLNDKKLTIEHFNREVAKMSRGTNEKE